MIKKFPLILCFSMLAVSTLSAQVFISGLEPENESQTLVESPYDSVEVVEEDVAPEVVLPLKIALVLSDIKANKDLEFARGMFLALDNFKNSENQISLSLINGNVADADSVTVQLDEFAPHIVVATYEKNFPSYLYDYSNFNDVKTINAFDARNEFYKSNPNIIQLLTPSNVFNERIADFFGRFFSDFEFVMIGEPDPGDNMFGSIASKYNDDVTNFVEKAELEQFVPSSSKQYLFYCFPTKKEEVKEWMEALAGLKKNNPNLIMATLGRASWITFTDLAKSFDAANVYIPSRFYFDPVSVEGKDFIKNYNEIYGRTPVKSFPVYSVMGYDLLNYLVSGMNATGNDFDKEWPATSNLQSDFSFVHAPDVVGYINPLVYVVRFNSSGGADKILLE